MQAATTLVKSTEPSKKGKEPEAGGNVYQLISRIQAALSKEGITKDRSNVQQGYKFRGIDDVFNAVAPLLSEHGLCVLPFVLERQVVEKQSKSGGVLFYVTVQVRFDFISSHDGSKHEVMMYGEAMDSGDKATNKALSAAYKYACLQAFSIPTEGENDADAVTHEVQATPPAASYKPSDPLRPHKDAYVIPALITPDGGLDFDTFTGELEAMLENARNPSDVGLINRSNAKTLRAMQTERPDLFAHIGIKFRETAQALA